FEPAIEGDAAPGVGHYAYAETVGRHVDAAAFDLAFRAAFFEGDGAPGIHEATLVCQARDVEQLADVPEKIAFHLAIAAPVGPFGPAAADRGGGSDGVEEPDGDAWPPAARDVRDLAAADVGKTGQEAVERRGILDGPREVMLGFASNAVAAEVKRNAGLKERA